MENKSETDRIGPPGGVGHNAESAVGSQSAPDVV